MVSCCSKTHARTDFRSIDNGKAFGAVQHARKAIVRFSANSVAKTVDYGTELQGSAVTQKLLRITHKYRRVGLLVPAGDGVSTVRTCVYGFLRESSTWLVSSSVIATCTRFPDIALPAFEIPTH